MIILALLVLLGVVELEQGGSQAARLKARREKIERAQKEQEQKDSNRAPASAASPGSRHYTFGYTEKLSSRWNSMLYFHDALPTPYRPEGVKLGKYHILREAPPALYNPYLLPESIREDSWYLPPTVEVIRFPKAD